MTSQMACLIISAPTINSSQAERRRTRNKRVRGGGRGLDEKEDEEEGMRKSTRKRG